MGDLSERAVPVSGVAHQLRGIPVDQPRMTHVPPSRYSSASITLAPCPDANPEFYCEVHGQRKQTSCME